MKPLRTIALAALLYGTSAVSGQSLPYGPPIEKEEKPSVASSQSLTPLQFQPGSLELQIDKSLMQEQPQKPASIYDQPCPPREKTNFFGPTEYAITPSPAFDLGLVVMRSIEQATNETPEERKPPFGFCEPQTIPFVINLGANLAGEAVSYVAGKGASYAVKRGVSRFANKSFHTVRRTIEQFNSRKGGIKIGKDISAEITYHDIGVGYNATEQATDAAIESLFGAPEQSPPLDSMAAQLGTPLRIKIDPCPTGDAGCQALIERINQSLHDQGMLPEAYRKESDQITNRMKGYDLQCHAYQLQLDLFEVQKAKTDESARNYLASRVDIKPPKKSHRNPREPGDGGMSRPDRSSNGSSSPEDNSIADSGDRVEFEHGLSQDTPDGCKRSVTEKVTVDKDKVTREVEIKETCPRESPSRETKVDMSKMNR